MKIQKFRRGYMKGQSWPGSWSIVGNSNAGAELELNSAMETFFSWLGRLRKGEKSRVAKGKRFLAKMTGGQTRKWVSRCHLEHCKEPEDDFLCQPTNPSTKDGARTSWKWLLHRPELPSQRKSEAEFCPGTHHMLKKEQGRAINCHLLNRIRPTLHKDQRQ